MYFIDNCYVIKFSNDENIKEKLEKEITIYKNLDLSYIPKYIASGNYNDYKYLIITKINGKSLYSIWHTLSEKERTNIIIEIAKIIKSFHQINGDFLTGYNATSFRKHIKNELLKIIEKLQKLNLNVKCLQDILNKSFDKLFCDIKIGLVYNDLHFDNFIYDGEKVYLIDFDRTIITSLDYDMMIFKTMCENLASLLMKKMKIILLIANIKTFIKYLEQTIKNYLPISSQMIEYLFINLYT